MSVCRSILAKSGVVDDDNDTGTGAANGNVASVPEHVRLSLCSCAYLPTLKRVATGDV